MLASFPHLQLCNAKDFFVTIIEVFTLLCEIGFYLGFVNFLWITEDTAAVLMFAVCVQLYLCFLEV